MSKFDDAVATYASSLKDTVKRSSFDMDVLTAVAKSLGPSIYLEDASRVSCADQVEKDRVKDKFLIGKLGLTDGPELRAAVDEVCEAMGSSNRNKYRAVFYYLLVEKFGKQGMYK